MTYALSSLAPAFLGLGAAGAAFSKDPVLARRGATAVSWLALGAAIVHAFLFTPDAAEAFGPLRAWIPAFVSVCTLAATSLSGAKDASPATLARILLMGGAGAAMALFRDPRAIAVLGTFRALLAFLELLGRTSSRRAARLFAIYQVPAAALILWGSQRLAEGRADEAVWPLMIGIAIREAILPFHSWFPVFVEEAPLGTVAAFAAPQLGVFLHLAFLGPHVEGRAGEWTAEAAIVTVLVCALLGVRQRDARRALAFLLMSQSGLVAFGIEGHSDVAGMGTILIWGVVGVAGSGLLMTLAALEARRGRASLDRTDSCFEETPRLAKAFLFFGLASVGLPGTLGFVAEDLLVQGSVHEHPWLALSLILATALNGMTVIRAYFAMFTGGRRGTGTSDLGRREWVTVTFLLLLLIGAGFRPSAPIRALRGGSASASPH